MKKVAGTIVAIGGGDIRAKSTAAIDREIIRLSGKRRPALLFIPTASSDDPEYCEAMQNYYGNFLGCKVEILRLLKESPRQAEISRKISSADIIYVGGGNTLKMMRLWRRLKVDRLLKIAYQRGAVLCGTSAGAICWFESGHSDSLSYYNPNKWKYIKVKGLGLIKGIFCPHYDSHTLRLPRREYFHEMIAQGGGAGIAVEDNCALVYRGGELNRVVTSKPKKHAWTVRRQKSKVVAEKITA